MTIRQRVRAYFAGFADRLSVFVYHPRIGLKTTRSVLASGNVKLPRHFQLRRVGSVHVIPSARGPLCPSRPLQSRKHGAGTYRIEFDAMTQLRTVAGVKISWT